MSTIVRASHIDKTISWDRGSQLFRIGFVQSISARSMVVTVQSGDVRLPYVRGDYSVGEFVAIVADPRGWWVSGPVDVGDIPESDKPSGVNSFLPQTKISARQKPLSNLKPPDPPKQRTVPISATWTGTFRGAEWRTDTRDLYQGDLSGKGLNTGVAFFGLKIVGLRADTSKPCSITLSYKRLLAGDPDGISVTWWTVSETAPVLGAPPTRLNSQSGPLVAAGRTGEMVLNSTLCDQLLEGDAHGLAIHIASNSPYARVEGSSIKLIVTYFPHP